MVDWARGEAHDAAIAFAVTGEFGADKFVQIALALGEEPDHFREVLETCGHEWVWKPGFDRWFANMESERV